MSHSASIGQLFMVGFDGLKVNAHIARMITDYRIGGVILFRRNVQSPQQVARLCRELQELNATVSNTPLLIAIDQEGGMVMRIEQGVTPIPSAMAFRQAGLVDDCEQLNRVLGDELAQIGINMNLAPVLDVNNNRLNPVIGVRAYGEDPDSVIRYGMAAMRGQMSAGLVVTAKHFPGHGDTSVDSHYGMPRVGHERARLDAIELAPFRRAIADGVPAIMTAHVVFPAIEPQSDLPATLSKAVLTDLLRNELGFDGVIITDCLEMAAIADGVGVSNGAVQTVRAGADIVLVSHLIERQIAALEAVQAALGSGELAAERIQSALTRIGRLKQQAAVADWRARPTEPERLMTPAAVQLSERVHAAAVRVDGTFHPLRTDLPVTLITVEMVSRTEIDEVPAFPEARASLLLFLQRAGLEVHEWRLGVDASAEDLAEAIKFITNAQQIVLQTYNAVLNPAQQHLIAQLPQDRLWLVAGRLPYDLDLAPQACGRLAAFGCRPAALLPVAGKLTGT